MASSLLESYGNLRRAALHEAAARRHPFAAEALLRRKRLRKHKNDWYHDPLLAELRAATASYAPHRALRLIAAMKRAPGHWFRRNDLRYILGNHIPRGVFDSVITEVLGCRSIEHRWRDKAHLLRWKP